MQNEKEIVWYVWKEEKGKIRKMIEKGSILQIRQHVLKMTPSFKEYCNSKSNQAQSYVKDGDACSTPACDFALIQVDFAKNYTCICQDKIQSHHWMQPQTSLFTVPLWYDQC